MRINKAIELAASSLVYTAAGDAGFRRIEQVSFCFDTAFSELDQLAPQKDIIIFTDENVYHHHIEKLSGYAIIKFPAGESHKNQRTVDYIIEEMIKMEAGKNTFLIGVGGGVVTDLTGYVASIYMRSIRFALVPTSILAMVDAAIGGKNGIDIGYYKNMAGTIYQPEFILYDHAFLQTLPVKEWVNGFAEVIKHACIRDPILFAKLERYTLHEFQSDTTLIAALIEENVLIKNSIVCNDEFEKGERKLLNFGHTIGHALENLHQLPHGHAISIGMVAACNLSEKLSGLHFEEARRVIMLLNKYHLPVDIETDHEKVFEILKMDKKRVQDDIHFILLNKIGHAAITPISINTLHQQIKEIL